MSLDGKTVFITGASRGIGEAAAREFARLGAKVAVAARSVKAVDEIAAEICAEGGHAIGLACDVADYDNFRQAVNRTRSEFGAIDVMINNAGMIEPIAPVWESDPQQWSYALDVNVKGVYHGIRTVLPQMIARGAGTILTVGSGAAHNPMDGWAHYNAGKAAALMLTRSVHKEAGAAGVVSVNLSPGTVATQMQREIKASGINPVSQLDWSDHIPPEWPAKALAWLAGPAGATFNGQEVSLRDPDIRASIGLA